MNKGFIGEERGVSYLIGLGQKIMQRNFRSTHGEVDIISVIDQEIHFVEVKNWDFYSELDLERVINNLKKQKIIKTARYFLFLHPEVSDFLVCFDVLFLTHNQEIVNYYPEAFGETDYSW